MTATNHGEFVDVRRPIPGLPGYLADPLGNIWSTTNWHAKGERVMDARPDQTDYLAVRVTINGKRRRRKVHRLVLLAFRGMPLQGEEGRHLNGDRLDNRLANLEWGTAKENAADRDRHGTTARGTGLWSAKLNADVVREILGDLDSGGSLRVVAIKYGVSKSSIARIRRRTQWGHVSPVR